MAPTNESQVSPPQVTGADKVMMICLLTFAGLIAAFLAVDALAAMFTSLLR